MNDANNVFDQTPIDAQKLIKLGFAPHPERPDRKWLWIIIGDVKLTWSGQVDNDDPSHVFQHWPMEEDGFIDGRRGSYVVPFPQNMGDVHFMLYRLNRVKTEGNEQSKTEDATEQIWPENILEDNEVVGRLENNIPVSRRRLHKIVRNIIANEMKIQPDQVLSLVKKSAQDVVDKNVGRALMLAGCTTDDLKSKLDKWMADVKIEFNALLEQTVANVLMKQYSTQMKEMLESAFAKAAMELLREKVK